MAKMKEADIQYVRVTYFHNMDTGKVYPIRWHIRAKQGSRTFESYGKRAEEYPYPLSKLPKAVQAFMETAKAGRPSRLASQEVVEYSR